MGKEITVSSLEEMCDLMCGGPEDMGEVKCYAKVLNPPHAGADRYIVARLVDGELYYYTSWETEEDAWKAAREWDNAVVVEKIDRVQCANEEDEGL